MTQATEEFVRPVRIPEDVPLHTAEPPIARAGESGTWKLTFTLTQDAPAGSELRILFHGGRNVKGAFSRIQVTDPGAPGFMSASTSGGDAIAACPEESTGGDVALVVPDGGIRAGETIVVTLGAGVKAPAERLSNKMFLLYRPEPDPGLGVPKMNAEPTKTILGACLIHITGNVLAGLRAYAPSQVAPGAPLPVLVRPEDEIGNISIDEPGELVARIDGKLVETVREPVEGTTCCRLLLTAPDASQVCRIEIEDRSNRITVTCNPVRVDEKRDGDGKVYWGYIHGHTELSDGAGNLDNYFTYMRDTLGLDFGSLGDHDHVFETSDDMWRMTQEATARYNAPGRFVTLLGYEWAKWRQNGDADRNVYYPEDWRPMYRSDDGHYPDPPALFEALRDETAMVIPHHPAEIGNHCDYKDHDHEKERLVEIFSVWGNSERSVNDGNPFPVRPSRHTPGDAPDAGEVPAGFVQRALAIGWRVGFTAGGDDHSGNPGDDRMRGAAPWRCRGGMFSVRAPELTREAIWDGLWHRHCVATTGPRIIVDFEMDGLLMGDECELATRPELAQRRTLSIAVNAMADIEKIEIVRNNEEVYVHEGGGMDVSFEWTDEDTFEQIALPPAQWCDRPFCFYYLRITQTDGDMAWVSPIWLIG